VEAASGTPEPYGVLLRACLPDCIASFFDACPLDGACAVETAGGVTRACFASGVRARVEARPGGAVVTTVTTPDGRTPCVRKTRDGVDYLYEQLADGRSARLSVVSDELRTAFCGEDTYSDVYRLPRCAALEQLPCPPGPCPP
jgi:hypothetical protein